MYKLFSLLTRLRYWNHDLPRLRVASQPQR